MGTNIAPENIFNPLDGSLEGNISENEAG